MSWDSSCYILSNGEVEGINDPDAESKFLHARNGDNLIFSFQCDQCHFCNIEFRYLQVGKRQDKNLLITIIQANIDTFWGRSESTVENNKNNLKRLIDIADDNCYGISSP